MNIAILGANGHIGKALANELTIQVNIDLYARVAGYKPYEKLFSHQYDAIINCTGIGNSSIIAKYPQKVVEVTEFFDILLDKYQKIYPKCKVVHISSGAIFGTSIENPISEYSNIIIYPNKLDSSSLYGLTKLYSEMKHRLSTFCNIDIRVMAFVSEYQPLDAPFFMSDVFNAIIQKKKLCTNNQNIKRDYIHPSDLAQLILLSLKEGINTSYDAYSKSPISKFDLLDRLHNKFNLCYEITDISHSITGVKNVYYSENHQAEKIGYAPRYSSVNTIENSITKIFK